MYDVNYLYDLLIELNMFTEEELELVTKLNGLNLQTLEDCLFIRYGYGSVEQMLEELGLEEEEEEDDEDDEDELEEEEE